MRFEFTTANRIIFGSGTRAEVPALAAPFGQRAFIVSHSHERVASLLDGFSALGISTVVFMVEKEPDLTTIRMATRSCVESNSDFIIGFGGGSVLDTGKTVAALVANSGDILNYLEIVGKGQVLEKPSVPYIAIPTTSGTGSEVTRNAVVSVPEKRIKVSLRSSRLLPSIAIIDPELSVSLPPGLTASTGLDALTQCIEPFVCNFPSPMTDAFCRDGILLAARSLLRAFYNGQDVPAREDMSLVSLYGGMALANARLGAVHGLAGPLGGMFPAPHGAVCARLLPFVMEANIRSLQEQAPGSPILERYTEVARLLTGNPLAQAEAGWEWVLKLTENLHIPPLSVYGIRQQDFPEIAIQAQRSSSMKGNPINLTNDKLVTILERSA